MERTDTSKGTIDNTANVAAASGIIPPFVLDAEANAYSSGVIPLTGDCWLNATLPSRGRLAIRKANSAGGPWPIVLMSEPSTDFEIRIFGETAGKYIKIETTSMPKSVEITPI